MQMSEVNPLLNETDTSERRFFLQAIDVESNCPLYEAGFSVSDVGMLTGLIGDDLSDIRCTRDLSPATAMKIVDRYDVSFDPGDHPVRLRPSAAHDCLPYQTHTGRELLLMLRGVKPLAVFDYPTGQCFSAETFFDPYAESGRFVKREYCVPILLRRKGDSKDLIYRYVLYALPHEQWRIDAYILLKQVMAEEGWSAGLERMEGELLGYEKWQNDIFIGYKKRMAEGRRKKREK
jgi:hypothetical protein